MVMKMWESVKQFCRDCWDGVHEEVAGMAVVAVLFHITTTAVGIHEWGKDNWIVGSLYCFIGPLYWTGFYHYNSILKQRDTYRKELGIGHGIVCQVYQEMLRLRKELKDVEAQVDSPK